MHASMKPGWRRGRARGVAVRAAVMVLASLGAVRAGDATPLRGPRDPCTAGEYERFHALLRFASGAMPRASIGVWDAAGPQRIWFGRYAPPTVLEVGVFAARAPAPGDGIDAAFGDRAEAPLRREGPSAFFDDLVPPPSLELRRLGSATLRPPRVGEVSVRVRHEGCYVVLLLRR